MKDDSADGLRERLDEVVEDLRAAAAVRNRIQDAAHIAAEAAEAERGRLRAENETITAEVRRLRDFIAREGYRRCDTPACNCNSFHGGHAFQRLRELSDALEPANGQTVLARAEELRAENATLRAGLLAAGEFGDWYTGAVHRQDGTAYAEVMVAGDVVISELMEPSEAERIVATVNAAFELARR